MTTTQPSITRRRYSVTLWDHDEQRFSDALARDHLDGPNDGLSFKEIGRAIRMLRGRGWDDVSMYVERTDEG